MTLHGDAFPALNITLYMNTSLSSL